MYIIPCFKALSFRGH
ncbi:hypothetical protein F383_14860 [Gossypium arboreum]|uniref:Uncharacterized protein n=1 Tax=Gossypium arboreum TaxID=29729 RepID=A0A0B0NAB8_GOSAR|nr:hypothetical protein F383_14860 [Gossypium arboreum]